MKKLIMINAADLLVLAGCFIWQLLMRHKQAVVYVDSIKLFNAYQFKKDMYNRIEQSYGSKMGFVDSLEQHAVAGQLNPDQLRSFEIDRDELSHAIATSKNETDRAIWERLNQVIKKFGDQDKYELIIGANGMGTVLYGQADKDITDAVINYANKEYENK